MPNTEISWSPLGKAIMNKAAQRGLSQTELAKAMAMAPQQLSALLRAQNCGLRTLVRLAEALNTTPADLLARRD